MRKVITVDTNKCSGCSVCELVCSNYKYKAFNPRLSLIGVIRSEQSLDAALSCQFCEKPTCVRVCPRKALTQDEATGVILVDENKCTGCGWCAASCEFGAVVVDPTKKVASMCDLCKGKTLCVEICPQKALELTALETISARKRLTSIATQTITS